MLWGILIPPYCAFYQAWN